MTPVSLTPWQAPPPSVSLDEQTVHLWRFRLDLPAAQIATLRKLLAPEEQSRAARLIDPVKAHAFVAARARMRQVLGRYLESAPGDVAFAYGEHGKPRLAGGLDEALRFNLSHAGCWGALVVSAGREVGVDIELIDRQLAFEKVAARYFSAQEAACLEQCAAWRRRRTFFRIWTRKEACLKGQGSGFSTARLHRQGPEWVVRSCALARDYLGAVAVAGPVTSLQRWALK